MPASYRAKTSKPTESSLAPAGPADGAAGPRAGRGKVADADAVWDALAALLGLGQVVEIRALHATTARDRREGVESGYFDDASKAAAAVVGLRSARGVYWTINPVAPALLARASNRLRRAGSGDTTADHDVVRRRWVPVDLDPVRPAGISSTDAEHAAALELARRISEDLANEGWPLPVFIDSGNGALLLYRCDLPGADEGQVAAVLAGLAARFDGDGVKVDTSVHNPARICRLPGTLNCKGDCTPERPPPHGAAGVRAGRAGGGVGRPAAGRGHAAQAASRGDAAKNPPSRAPAKR